MNDSTVCIQDLSTEDTMAQAPQVLPPYWQAQEFYTLGVLQEPSAATSQVVLDLSEHDFSQAKTIWIVIGDAMLAGLKQIQTQLHPKSRVLVMVHPEVMDHTPWHDLRFLMADARFFFVPLQDVQTQAQTISGLMDEEQFDCWKPVMGEIAQIEWVQHYRDLVKMLTPLLNRKLVNKATLSASSHLFLRNALINVPLTCSTNPWNDYKDLYLNKPALIVATGPSLNKQLDLIARHKDEFVVIAVDPAVPILKQHGVIPDFVLTIDPRKRPYWDQDALDDRTTFVVEVSACPDSAWSSTKKYLVTAGHQHVYGLLKQLECNVGWIVTGGSVSSNGFSLAEHLGCNPIVMVGQDLAWTDGKDHAEGYTSQYTLEKLKLRHERGYDIPGYGGQMVRTEPQLLFYKSWFEQQIKAKPHLTVINATEGGAIIEGALHIPFAAVCQEIMKLGPVAKGLDRGTRYQVDAVAMARYRDQVRAWDDEISRLKDEVKNIFEKLEKVKNKPARKLESQVKAMNRKILGLAPDVKLILDMFSNMAMAMVDQKIDAIEEKGTLKSIYEGYTQVYKSVLIGAEYSQMNLKKIIGMLDDLILHQRVGRQLLIDHRLHNWELDGTKVEDEFFKKSR